MQNGRVLDVNSFNERLKTLSPHRIRLLEVVYNFEDHWASRAEIAFALGKQRLTIYDQSGLNELAEEGLLEMNKRPMSSPLTEFAYLYRVPDSIADVMQAWADWRERTGTFVELQKRRPLRIMEHLGVMVKE
jgi:hypothetical protein